MLYHRQIGFPSGVKLPRCIVKLTYSSHARSKGISTWRLPHSLDFSKATIIEIETNAQYRIVKLLCRITFSKRCDLVLAVHPDGFVRTVYINSKNDHHSTLCENRYLRP
jgi:hypothetical protein